MHFQFFFYFYHNKRFDVCFILKIEFQAAKNRNQHQQQRKNVQSLLNLTMIIEKE